MNLRDLLTVLAFVFGGSILFFILAIGEGRLTHSYYHCTPALPPEARETWPNSMHDEALQKRWYCTGFEADCYEKIGRCQAEWRPEESPRNEEGGSQERDLQEEGESQFDGEILLGEGEEEVEEIRIRICLGTLISLGHRHY
jgi:hypothetical protein